MSFEFKNRIRHAGRVILPPSKSEAIRACLLLALSGDSPELAVKGYPKETLCEDVLCAIGAAGFLGNSPYVGGSAALLRMLLPIELALFGRAEVYCEPRLVSRGIEELEEALGVRAEKGKNRIVLTKKLDMERLFIDCSRSSQFLSGLLIALPLIPHDCEIIIKNGLVSRPYAEMTCDFVRLFGGRIEETGEGFITHPSRYAAPESLPVSGDVSYAAVFEAMNALGGSVEVIGKSDVTRQPDKRFFELVNENECDITDCPDLTPLLAAVACGKNGETVIRGTARLKTKESDRAEGVAQMINDLGGNAEAGENSLLIRGRGGLDGGCCSVLSDHRLVFAAAVMAMISSTPVVIDDIGCVKKSAPQFPHDIKRLTGKGI